MHCAILAYLPRGYPEAHGRGYPVAGKFQKLLVPLSP